MLNIVKNNPYRFLGVFSNSPTRDRVANLNRLKAYLKVGKTVEFPIDLVGLLQHVNRTVEGMETASSSINLSKDQIKYAMFWFINFTSIDKIALEHLQKGNSSKANELFNKRADFSSLINRGVLSFILDNLSESIRCITKVIHDDEMREAFVAAVCGNTFSISEEDLAILFMDTLLEEIPINKLKQLFFDNGTSSDDDDYLSEQAISEPIALINSAISKAKNVDRDEADDQYDAGLQLKIDTKDALAILEEHFFTGEYVNEDVAMLDIGLPIQIPRKVYDEQYVFLADSLAKQILQCGIYYYNNSEEEEDIKIDKAYELQSYALSIAIGKLTKDRCKENVQILEDKKRSLPPKEVKYYDKLIKEAFAKYMSKPEKISYAIDLIKTCAPYLMSIKEVLGAKNDYYLKTSTLIVNASLRNVIKEFNSVMNDDLKLELAINRFNAIRKITLLFDEAWKATLFMDKLDMESEFKNGRYRQNRDSLKNQVKDLINIYQTVDLEMKSETQFFNSCNTISDYNSYNKIFPNGKYAAQVKTRIEKCEFDACKTTQDCQNFKNKYPRTSLPIEDKWEECFFDSCRTISQYETYLRTYPSGKWRTSASARIDKLSYEACKSLDDYKKYVSKFPFGKYKSSAQQYIDEEEMWIRCTSSDSKDLYKEYLSKYPNGRHKTEAEQKASACYIATMVYGDYNHPHVMALRSYRDNTLRNTNIGRAFISFYYKHSPSWVDQMKDKKLVNKIIKKVLDQFIKFYNHENK